MREEKLINRGWQFALLPCAPIDAKTAKKKELQIKQVRGRCSRRVGKLAICRS